MEWIVSETPQDYQAVVSAMEKRVGAIRAGSADDLVWLLEHPPLYTAGTSADPSDLLTARFPVFRPGGAGNIRITGRVSAWPMSCLILKNDSKPLILKNMSANWRSG